MGQARFVDVIAPVKQLDRGLLDRLRSLLADGGSRLGRLLVVVDAAAGATWDELARLDARCVPLRGEPGSGWVDLCNRGLAERRGDVVILHPAATMAPGWLEALELAAHSAERVALAAALSEGDGLGAGPVDRLAFQTAVKGLPPEVTCRRSGRTCNYLRGDILDAVGSLDPAFASPRAAIDDWLARARNLGFFARRAHRALASTGGSRAIDEDWAVGPEDAARLGAKHPRLAEWIARFEKSLDARLAGHAMEFQTTGRIKVALDLRHLPLEVNGTKNYAIALGKALANLPEVELTLLANHPLQADGVPGRIVHPNDWADDVAVIHKPAQIFDRRHSRLLYESSAHVVITYQDLIAYRMPSAFESEADLAAYQDTSRITLPAAQAVLAISNNVGVEIEDEFGIPREDVPRVLEGVDIEEFAAPIAEAKRIRERFRLPDRYFFSLANDYPHKNLSGLLEAYSKFRQARPGDHHPALVLAGSAPRAEAELLDRPGGAPPGVRFLGRVSVDELKVLYGGAEAFVFASLYEGFGLPPLEAIAAGSLVVAMPFSSVPEVCGDGVLYAEGLSADDLARALERIIDDEPLRRELRERGRRRIEELQWRETARNTFEAYRKIVLNPSPRSLQARRSLAGAIAHWADVAGPFAPPAIPPAAAAVAEGAPPGVLNACRTLRDALARRIRRDLARAPGIDRLRRHKASRLAHRFIQIVRTDGLRAASERALRKARTRARSAGLLHRFFVIGRARGPTCSYYHPPAPIDRYEAWLRANAANPRRATRLREAIEAIDRPTTFSILVPIYNPPVEYLAAAVESVFAQSFANWELILVDDASTDPRVLSYLKHDATRDPRVRLIRRATNGNISAATNTAAEHARGEFLVFLDHDDLLHPEALAHLAIYIGKNKNVDLIYTDDDKLGIDGGRFAPQFKPDWSPELLLSFCYTGHLTAARASLYRQVGGMRLGFEGSQDHDFWLRASERAREVGHVPQSLYHWRVLPGSTAASGHEKPRSFEAGRRAVAEAFGRRGVPCSVKQPEWAVAVGCGVFEPVMPDDGPSVAILILANNNRQVAPSLFSSLEGATYKNYRVYLIEHEGGGSRTTAHPSSASPRVLRVEAPDGRFNPAAIRDRAAAMVDEDLLLFLDADVEAANPRWLSQMVGWSRLPGVGSVGARLLGADRRVQSAGIVHGAREGLAGLAFNNLPWWDGGDMGLARVSRNCAAVSSACMLIPRGLFIEMGGFDERRFATATALGDADLGHRLRDAGYRHVLCAEAEMSRREDSSESFADDPTEEATYRRLHGGRRDPYFNPHLDAGSESFRLKPTVAPVGPAARPIPLLAATHNLNWEGAPGFELELIAGLKAMGAIEPTVISPVDGPLRAEYERAGISLRIDPSLAASFQSINSYRDGRRRIADWIVREGFEVVHANTAGGFWAADAARAAGVASVWTIHESEPWQTYFDHLPAELARAALAAMRYPYRVVFIARSTAKVWSALDSEHRFGLIRNGLDADRFARKLGECSRAEARARLGLTADDVCVLLLGTVCERKGQHDLVHAFGRLDARTAAATRCLVVGARDDLAYGRELKRLARELGADRRDRFQIVDETGDTAPYWQAADVFCCTSRMESYPYVILEAMGRGLPIITTGVYGIAEQVRPGLNALMYEPGDVDAMRRHLENLIGDGSLRRRMAAASSQVLEALPSHAEKLRRYAELFRAAAESGAAADGGAAPSVVPAARPATPRVRTRGALVGSSSQRGAR